MANHQNRDRDRDRNEQRYRDRDERDFNPGYSLEGENWQDEDRGNFQQRQQRSNRNDRQGSGQNDWFNRERENVQRGNNVNNGDWQQGRMGMDDTAGWERGSYGDSGRNQGYGPSSREFDQNFGNSQGYGRQGYGWQQNQGWGSSYDRPGEFVGKGPKGYKRSDERIKEDISEQLMQHGQIDASEIEVQVQDGTVTLTGTVNNRQAKRITEDLAENISGVQDVNNQIRVTREDGYQKNSQGSSQNGQGTLASAHSSVENGAAARRNK